MNSSLLYKDLQHKGVVLCLYFHTQYTIVDLNRHGSNKEHTNACKNMKNVTLVKNHMLYGANTIILM